MKKKSKAPKIILTVLITALVLAGIGYFGYVFFQVEDVEVAGNGKFTDVYIKGLAGIPPKTHMLALDTDRVKERIEAAEPYIEVLSVSKKFPREVLIEVKERQPRALVANADTYLLTDKDAIILEMVGGPVDSQPYPVVEGFAILSAALGSQISTEDSFKISVMGEILTAMENRQMNEAIKTIDLSDINNIRMTSSIGLAIKFGQADKITDKIKDISIWLPKLTADGRTQGVLDVSAGAFPIYKQDQDPDDAAPPSSGGPDGTDDVTDEGGGGEGAENNGDW